MSDCCTRLCESKYEFFLSLRSAVTPRDTPPEGGHSHASCGLQREPVSCSWVLLPGQTSSSPGSPSTVGPGLLSLLSACPPTEPHPAPLLPRFLLRALRHAGSPVALASGPKSFFGVQQQFFMPNQEATFCCLILHGQLGCRRGPT